MNIYYLPGTRLGKGHIEENPTGKILLHLDSVLVRVEKRQQINV